MQTQKIFDQAQAMPVDPTEIVARTLSSLERSRQNIEKATEVLSAPVKFDEGKPRFELLPANALMDLASAATYGAKKYGDDNWLKGGGMTLRRLFGASIRHAVLWLAGEDRDTESGLPHLAHATWGFLAILECIHLGIGKDDRVHHWILQGKSGPS